MPTMEISLHCFSRPGADPAQSSALSAPRQRPARERVLQPLKPRQPRSFNWACSNTLLRLAWQHRPWENSIANEANSCA